MMMMGLYFMKEVPFKEVYLHTLVRDEQGQKMSKTKGNVINPLELMEMYGADALRFSMAALAAPARDVKFSPSIVEGYRNFATKLWNATRFCLQNECFYRQKFNPQSCTLNINRWMVGEIIRLGRTLDLELADYHFNTAASALYQTVWRQFCDWYLEFIKPILLGHDEDMKKETRDCAGWCVGMLSHLLHPFMPFITEEIWQHIAPEQSSLLITSLWPFQDETLDALITDPAQKDITWIINLITALRGLRSDLNLTPSLNLTVGLSEGSDEARQRLLQYQPLLEKLGRIERIEENSKIPEGAAQLVLEDATFYVPVGDVIDVVQEQKRLQKSLLEIGKEIQQLQMKLENKEFIAKAPSEIIEKNQDRLREIKEIHVRYEQALKSFV
jgi:valyl-tRNA synthetase